MIDDVLPDRSAALARLQAFMPHAGREYAATRNFDRGPGRHDNVSRLSPYLRVRLITEEEVLRAVLGRHSAAAAEKFVKEVFWRTYWKGWLEQRPSVWAMYQNDLNRVWNDVQTQAGLRSRWEAACGGETGIECFDAWAKELIETGYLHNHARMWFASIWIFTLQLPWQLGADFFLRHLLDGDPASNTLGWRWVAGIQTPGKTYLARTSNISKFTEGRFHPKWQLASDAPPLEASAAPDPQPLPALRPVDPDKRTGFLLHDEDLSPGFAVAGLRPAASAVLAPQTRVGPLMTSPAVTAFRAACQRDATDRWTGQLGDFETLCDAAALRDWADRERLEQVVTPYAPIGPAAKVLNDFARSDGAPVLCRVLRPYDAAAWPYATRGFFGFRKHIPDLLLALTGNRAT